MKRLLHKRRIQWRQSMSRLKDSPCVTTLYLLAAQLMPAMIKYKDRVQAPTFATFITSLTPLPWTNPCRGLLQKVWLRSVRYQQARRQSGEDNNRRRSGPWVVRLEVRIGTIQAMHWGPTYLMWLLTASTLSLTQSTIPNRDSQWVLLEARKCKFYKRNLKIHSSRCQPEFTVLTQRWMVAETKTKNCQTWQCHSFIHPQRPTRLLRGKFNLHNHQ